MRSTYLTLIFLLLLPFVWTGQGQTAAFTYQGRLTDGISAAQGMYDLRFRLFDGSENPITPYLERTNVNVVNGIFTVELSFGPPLFSGEERFLEVSVKKPAEVDYTLLSPRQRVTSSPYSIRSLNSATSDNTLNLNGIPAAQFVQDSDSRLTDSRDPNPGSSNYVQNTAAQQISSNFNISGTGTASILNATTQFNLNGSRVLFANAGNSTTAAGLNTGLGGSGNSFFGFSAGLSTTTGFNNAFYGNSAGRSNTQAAGNSFFGHYAGFSTSTGGLNSFYGHEAGYSNTAATNSFFGYRSGYENTNGAGNSFFGFQAGESSAGSNNSFFGHRAGRANQQNGSTFFGYQAGMSHTTGLRNAFFGENSGRDNVNGSFNSFFGALAGQSNNGPRNSFFGALAGSSNTTGSDNSFFGSSAGDSNTDGTGNSFFGSSAGGVHTTGVNNAFFGRSAGSSSQTGSGNAFFGANSGVANNASLNTFIGTSAGFANTGNRNTLVGNTSGSNLIGGNDNTFVGVVTGSLISNITGNNNTLIGGSATMSNNVSYGTAIGSEAHVGLSNTIVLGRSNGQDIVIIHGLGGGGSTALCRNASNQISSCSSSLRYKSNVDQFASGLNIVRRLQPVSFNWKDGGLRDLGLGAEQVAEIEPLLVTFNEAGQVEGVKYDRIGVVLLNAVKEQQAQIERQQKQIEEQRAMIEGLRQLACASNPQSSVCRLQEDKENEN